LAYGVVSLFPSAGQIAKCSGTVEAFDRIYFSSVSYTTLGYGDLVRHSPPVDVSRL